MFNGLGTALIVPFNFLALFTLARRLGAESLGTFFTIFAISAVIHWIADGGTTTVLTRRVARNRDDLKTIVPESVGVLMVVCAISSTLFFTFAVPWIVVTEGHASLSVMAVAAAAMWSRHAIDFASNVFRGLERFEFENLARVVQTALFYLFVWVGVQPGAGDELAAFIAFAASNLVAAALLWTILLRTERCAGFRLSLATIKAWWRESLPLGVGDVVRQVLMQMDTLLIAAFRSPAVVGLFSIAARPLQPLQLVPRIIVSVTFPAMSRSGHVDRSSVSRTFANTTTLLWAASLPVSIIVSMCAEPLIRRTAGLSFIGAIGPLQALIWSTGLIFINAQLRLVLTALDQERYYWRLICGILAAKVVLGLSLIPLWGIYGACVANLLAESLLCIGGLVLLRRLGVAGPDWSQLARLTFPAIAMAAPLWMFVGPRSSLIQIALASFVAGVVYVAACLASGVWSRADILRVQDAVRNIRRRPTTGVLGPEAAAQETSEVVTI